MTAPAIGALRHKLVIERAERTADDGGGGVLSWVEAAWVWAAITAESGEERPEADRIAGRTRHLVVIRWRDDVTPAMRFRLGPRVFAIEAVLDPDGRRRFLQCRCREQDL